MKSRRMGGRRPANDRFPVFCTWHVFLPTCVAGKEVLRTSPRAEGSPISVETPHVPYLEGFSNCEDPSLEAEGMGNEWYYHYMYK